MDLINNRYRILRNIKQNRLLSSYLALDIKREHAVVQLNIINSEYFPEAVLNFYNREFMTLTTIRDANIIRLYGFGLIRLIDNKKMDSNQCYYINESIEENGQLFQLVANMEEEDILNLFIEVCKSINYLHLRGFVYGGINIDNIYICNSHIKFKDMASIELEKYDYWSPKNDQILFKAPEILAGDNASVSSDIYSLGVLLIALCKKEIGENLNVSKEILRIKNLKEPYCNRSLNFKRFLVNMVPIIQKMTEKSVNKRYKSIHEVVEDINKVFGKDYRAHRQEQLEKLNFKTKIVGRDYEINNIMNAYNSMVKLGFNEKYIVVHGEYGIGKTKLLKELEHSFILKNISVYSDFTMESSNVSKGKAFYEILRKIIGESDFETLERYELELAKLIPEFGEKNRITPLEPLTGEKEKIRVLNGICGFINDFLKGKPAVFIIDNIHMASDFSIEILEYMYLRGKNIMFILSYCDGEFTDNKKLVEFTSRIAGNTNVVDVPLRGLSGDDAILMIQDILRMPTKPAGFGRSISSKTYGNPLFIEETVKNFFSGKIIYVDPLTGVWNSKFDYDYNKLPIPSNMEQAVLSQIKDIDNLSNEILKILSIFNTGTTVDNINCMLQMDEAEILESINNLEAKGIICRKIEDRGFVYDFSNRILKNLISEKLDDEYKKAKHEAASTLLEHQYEEGRENREELIYHFEKSGQKEKVIKYCLENAERMENFKNRSEAIKNLEKAISMLSDFDTSLRKIELLLRVGNIYETDGNLPYAIRYYEEAEILAEKQINHKCQIDALNRLANAYFRRNDIEKTLIYMTKSEKILKEADFLGQCTDGYLECKQIQSRVYLLKQDYKKAKEICKKCIDLCGDSYYKLKGLFYKNLGNAYLETSKIDKALDNYKKSMTCFEKINFAEGIVMALNNIAVVYGDFYQDNEMTINYLKKMKEISERNHITNHEVMALTNLGCSYYYEWQYETALEYLLDATEKSKKIEFETNIFYNYNFLSSIYLRLCNFKEAYEHHLLAKKEFEDYPDHGKEVVVYYQMGSELFYAFGDLEKARKYVNQTLDIYKNDELLPKWDSQILFEHIEIQSKIREEDILENLLSINKTIENFKSSLRKLEILYDTAIILYLKGFKTTAVKLLNQTKKIKVEDKPSIIEIKSLYLNGVIGKGNNKLKFLNSALEMAKKDNEKSLHWKICCALGDYYFSKRDYFYAVNYYFEACEVIRGLSMQLPDEFILKFIKSNGILRPFNKLTAMRGSQDYNKIFDINNDDITISDDQFKNLFDYEQFGDILNNKYFIKSAKKIYNSYMPKGIRNATDIIKNLYADPLKNLDIIAKYLASVTLATKSLIIMDDFHHSYYTIASNDGSNHVPGNKYIFEKVKAIKEPTMINENSLDNSIDIGLLPEEIKAVICVPIIMNADNDMFLQNDNKRRNNYFNNPIKGYIYLETERILNNFNNEGLKKCRELSRLTGAQIERYQLQISSSTDKLTGTLTRKFLEDMLTEHIDRADNINGYFSIIMMDLDHFKQINDRFGHQTGDEVLGKACRIIKNSIRKDDVCGRYGGEEFIIILSETDAEGAYTVAEKLRKEIEQAKILGNTAAVTISMGISTYPYHAQWKQELIEKADQALYVSKELGRNRCTVWSNEFSSKVKGTNKLTGIVSGNIVQDSRNVLVMLDVIELIKSDLKFKEKIYNLLGRIIEITESQYGFFFTVEDGKVKDKFTRKIFEEDWIETSNYNKDIVNSVILKKQGVYITDWDDTSNYDTITGVPDWHSVAVVPLIKNGQVNGVLYLSVSTKLKEYKFDEFNFINTLGELSAAIL